MVHRTLLELSGQLGALDADLGALRLLAVTIDLSRYRLGMVRHWNWIMVLIINLRSRLHRLPCNHAVRVSAHNNVI